ncbi:DUF1934 domain-containing protein [Vagococcus sp.]|uniref:DUF1934 domain-containing protein n=1 Tax=Vagococcus sp. TaxID=1933889 RepID=UPI003F99B861
MEERISVPVEIKIKTEVFQENELVEHVVEVSGKMVRIGEVLYLRYDEKMEGVDSEIPVTLKILPDGKVELIRAGELRMKLRFHYQSRQETAYKSPFGQLDIATYTNNIRVSLKDRPYSGRVLVDYDLFAGADKLGVYHLDLSFTA